MVGQYTCGGLEVEIGPSRAERIGDDTGLAPFRCHGRLVLSDATVLPWSLTLDPTPSPEAPRRCHGLAARGIRTAQGRGIRTAQGHGNERRLNLHVLPRVI